MKITWASRGTVRAQRPHREQSPRPRQRLRGPLRALTLVSALLHSGMAQASALSDLASSMAEGEWQHLPTSNLGDHFLFMTVTGEPWWADMGPTWSNYLSWNPATRDLHWMGAAHLAPYAFIRYSEETNAWTHITDVVDCMKLPGYEGCFNHGYDAGAIDQVTGTMYFHAETTFLSYDVATKEWGQWDQPGFESTRSDALEYFPPLTTLAHVYGGRVRLYHPDTKALETVASDLEMGFEGNTAEYSHVYQKLFFGGGSGSRAFYSLSANKDVARLADAPEPFDCARSSLAVDPVSGEPLLLANSNAYYAYDPVTDTWSALPSPPEHLFAANGAAIAVLASGLPQHGVVFYMAPVLEKVYLYKHTSGEGLPLDTTAPAAPQRLRID